MRHALNIHVRILLLSFWLIWGTSLVCTIIGHHTTERNYAHAHFTISMPAGDHLPATHNGAAPGSDSIVNQASAVLVTFHNDQAGTTESVSGQPLIVPEYAPPLADLWEFPLSLATRSPSEVFQIPPDRPPSFPV